MTGTDWQLPFDVDQLNDGFRRERTFSHVGFDLRQPVRVGDPRRALSRLEGFEDERGSGARRLTVP